MDEKILLQTFAFNFKVARMRLKLSQGDIVEKTDLSHSYISNVENARHSISLLNAHKLAKAVGKTIDELLMPLK